MRKWRISLSTVSLSAQAKRNIQKVVNSNRLTRGPFTEQFEREFARLHNRKYAISVNSGTSGLQVALVAMKGKYGWKDNDEVLVPAVTFIASSNSIIHAGLKRSTRIINCISHGSTPGIIQHPVVRYRMVPDSEPNYAN